MFISYFCAGIVAVGIIFGLGTEGFARPQVLLYHGFNDRLDQADFQTAPVRIRAGAGVERRSDGFGGQIAWFPEAAEQATFRIDLTTGLGAGGWTVALWESMQAKEWLTAPEDNLITLLDAEDQPIVKLSKSGGVFVYDEQNRVTHLDCFDALYWVRGSREHLTLTWDAAGSGVPSPRGMLRAYWKARPYAALALDLDRQPVALEIGQPLAGMGVDELYVLDKALSLRGIWELMRHDGGDVAALEEQLALRETIEAARPMAARRQAWARLTQSGIFVEAESDPQGEVVSSPVQDGARWRAGSNNASTAAGRCCVVPGTQTLTWNVNVPEKGEYTLAIRYCLDRRIAPLWPQNSTARTPWTENYAEIETAVDDRAVGTGERDRLYPTGLYDGHRGDVEMWAWQTLLSGTKLSLEAGVHTIRVTFATGLAEPIYDALLLSKEAGPTAPHPRWVDHYRIPPSWWVAEQRTAWEGPKRLDTYTVLLRNRNDEPCRYEILADFPRVPATSLVPADKEASAAAGKIILSDQQITLGPFEEKALAITFESAREQSGYSHWANIFFWNEDVALRQKYRLWNLVPSSTATPLRHPVLVEPPDTDLQALLRDWLQERQLESLTPKLQGWVGARNVSLAEGSAPVRGFPQPFSGDRLKALDTWMQMDDEAIEAYLPDGPAEFNGYGAGWERMGVEYSGLWHKMPQVHAIQPAGDIDQVTSLTVSGPPQQGKTAVYSKTYTAAQDLDLISCVRDTRWVSMMGHDFYGGAPYGDTVLGRTSHAGITLLAEAYYLTGDKAYARKAFQMLKIFARKYTHLTKHFNFGLHREDRDWWGGRIGGRYLAKFGPRYYHALGVYVLDLIWDGISPAERTIIEHNVLRWGMYEGMSGPLFEVPEYFAATNKEDLPFLAMGRVLGDPAPQEGIRFFYDVFKDVVLADGIHQCSIGSYGGVSSYAAFLKKLHDLGLDVSEDRALRKLFSAHPSFIFSGGGLPNIDDGGGVNINGLGAGFGCPSRAQYAWGKELFGDATFDVWPDLIEAAQRVNSAPPPQKAAVMRQEYLEGQLPLETLWPHVYIAPVKGLAMLRNRLATDPLDWKEVIFDYGLFGGRSHGHAAKLATIPSFNGQIVSMEYGYGAHGKPVSTGFHTRSYAHNVVVVDGREQFHTSGAVPVGSLREAQGGARVQWVDAESSRIYQGIDLRRTVFTTDFGIVDLHHCQAKKEHQYDWMFHSFGTARSVDAQPTAVPQLAEAGPLTFAVNPRSFRAQGTTQVIWENSPVTKPPTKRSTGLLHENSFVRLWSLPATETKVALFGIPIVESVGGEIDYVMLRRKAAATVFATVQEPWRESTGPQLSGVRSVTVQEGSRQVQDHEAFALEVTRQNGNRSVFFVNYNDRAKTIGAVTTDAPVATWNITSEGQVSDEMFSEKASFKTR